MGRHKSLSSRDVIKMLTDDGWFRVEGSSSSHQQFKHAAKRGRVTVKHPQKDIPLPTMRSIYRQAGWDWKGRK